MTSVPDTELRVAIRCDGSFEVGMGHIVECLGLLRSLRRQVSCEPRGFIRRESPGATLFRAQGCACEELERAHDEDEELRALTSRLRTWAPDVTIVSLLGRSASYYERLKATVPYLVAIFDDGTAHDRSAHLVVDFALSAKPAWPESVERNGVTECRGPAFALLDETLHTYWRKPRMTRQTCQRILVTQGGSDPFGLTVKILKALGCLPVTEEVVVVLGPAVSPALAREVEALRAVLSFRWRVERAIPTSRFHELMDQSDFAVTAAGNTLYELCAIGIPALVLCHHERQHIIARAFQDYGAAWNVGIGMATPIATIAEQIQRLRGDMKARTQLSQNGKALMDGLGCQRVAAVILKHMGVQRCGSL